MNKTRRLRIDHRNPALPIFLCVFAAAGQSSAVAARADQWLTLFGIAAVVVAYGLCIRTVASDRLARAPLFVALMTVALMVYAAAVREDDFEAFPRRFTLTMLLFLPAAISSASTRLTVADAGRALAFGLALPVFGNVVSPGSMAAVLSSASLYSIAGIEDSFANYQGLARGFGAGTIVAVIYWFDLHTSRSRRGVALILGLGMLYAAAAAGGRGAILAMGVVVGLLILGNSHRRFWSSAAFVVILAGAAAVTSFSQTRGAARLLGLADGRATGERAMFWDQGWNYIISSPRTVLVGGGAGGFSRWTGGSIAATPHNVLLEVGTIWGLAACIAVTMVLLALMQATVQSLRARTPDVGRILFLHVAVFYAITVFSSSSLFQAPISFVVFVLIVRFVVIERPTRVVSEQRRRPSSFEAVGRYHTAAR